MITPFLIIQTQPKLFYIFSSFSLQRFFDPFLSWILIYTLYPLLTLSFLKWGWKFRISLFFQSLSRSLSLSLSFSYTHTLCFVSMLVSHCWHFETSNRRKRTQTRYLSLCRHQTDIFDLQKQGKKNQMKLKNKTKLKMIICMYYFNSYTTSCYNPTSLWCQLGITTSETYIGLILVRHTYFRA